MTSRPIEQSRFKSSRIGTFAALLAASFMIVATPDAHAERGDYSFMSRAGSESGFQQNVYPHESGLYARGHFGFGYLRTNFKEDGETNGSLKGFAVDWQAALGGIVVPNLALHATFWGQTAPSPEIEINGLGSIELDDTRFSMFGIGGGATGYFGYSGLFLSGSVGAAKLRFNSNSDLLNIEESSNWGFAFDVMSGKEWIVGSGVGLGVAIGGGMHLIPDEGNFKNQGFNVSARFIITLN